MNLSESLRLGMRRLASGVCILSSQADNIRYAMTVSSVTSLSDNPASLLVCVNKAAAIQPFLKSGQPFAVSVLSQKDRTISDLCAQPNTGPERFNQGEWLEHPDYQTPYLASSLATFFCCVDNDNYCYGTHQIVIGRLQDTIITDNAIEPLIYVDGGYQ